LNLNELKKIKRVEGNIRKEDEQIYIKDLLYFFFYDKLNSKLENSL